MAAPPILTKPVEQFERNRSAYQAAGYNETQVRREFLDPFFKALGWDVDNEQGHAEAYKDVIHEDAIKVGGATWPQQSPHATCRVPRRIGRYGHVWPLLHSRG